MSHEKPRKWYNSWQEFVRHNSRILGNTIDGRLSNFVTTTLKTSSASTTISDALCTISAHISVVPESVPSASAVASHYIKTKLNGSFVIAHASTTGTQSYTVTYTIIS